MKKRELEFKGKPLKEYEEEEIKHKKIIHEKYKPLLRKLLELIEENLPLFNDRAIALLEDKGSGIEDLRQKTSDLKWYISHNYFKKGRPRACEGKSNPPISYLFSKINGQSVPLSRDVATLIEPQQRSELYTRGAVDRLHMYLTHTPYNYLSPEEAKADQAAMHKAKVTDKLDLKKRAEYEQARRDKKRLKPPTKAEYKKAGEEYLKEKVAYRKKRHEELADKKERALKEFKNETRRIRERGN